MEESTRELNVVSDSRRNDADWDKVESFLGVDGRRRGEEGGLGWCLASWVLTRLAYTPIVLFSISLKVAAMNRGFLGRRKPT
jgi:hypothetical protein